LKYQTKRIRNPKSDRLREDADQVAGCISMVKRISVGDSYLVTTTGMITIHAIRLPYYVVQSSNRSEDHTPELK